ncbi:MAG: PEGA domain-containing protein, partial [Myxococcales bacterium]|nr:PEGA domain-containing protein [Myxococcales bacterium]
TSGGESVWATVYVDGKKIGESPTSVTLAPGRHRVEIKRPGYKPLRRTVTVRGGRTQPLVLPLSKHSPRKTSPRPAR